MSFFSRAQECINYQYLEVHHNVTLHTYAHSRNWRFLLSTILKLSLRGLQAIMLACLMLWLCFIWRNSEPSELVSYCNIHRRRCHSYPLHNETNEDIFCQKKSIYKADDKHLSLKYNYVPLSAAQLYTEHFYDACWKSLLTF